MRLRRGFSRAFHVGLLIFLVAAVHMDGIFFGTLSHHMGELIFSRKSIRSKQLCIVQ